ncbi:hypothetical protein [Lignipirellula cremea]|uniref:hypothetical protein n=1 Tax=Lignipirellula cremea TaxID=2528010 RepID=UPI0018D22549|nr:hypothetical protein [Lignipirellula cremea]
MKRSCSMCSAAGCGRSAASLQATSAKAGVMRPAMTPSRTSSGATPGDRDERFWKNQRSYAIVPKLVSIVFAVRRLRR